MPKGQERGREKKKPKQPPKPIKPSTPSIPMPKNEPFGRPPG